MVSYYLASTVLIPQITDFPFEKAGSCNYELEDSTDIPMASTAILVSIQD